MYIPLCDGCSSMRLTQSVGILFPVHRSSLQTLFSHYCTNIDENYSQTSNNCLWPSIIVYGIFRSHWEPQEGYLGAAVGNNCFKISFHFDVWAWSYSVSKSILGSVWHTRKLCSMEGMARNLFFIMPEKPCSHHVTSHNCKWRGRAKEYPHIVLTLRDTTLRYLPGESHKL